MGNGRGEIVMGMNDGRVAIVTGAGRGIGRCTYIAWSKDQLC